MHRFLLASLTCFVGLGAAYAQVKPEVTILLDAAGRTELRPDGTPPVCADLNANMPPADPAARGDANRSKMGIIQDTLVGGSRFEPWCIVHSPLKRAADHIYGSDGYAHVRSMCCEDVAGGLCRGYKPCGNDHGMNVGADATGLGYGVAYDEDGIIRQFRDRVKFGLMVSDSMPGPRDLTSYGNDGVSAHRLQERVGTATIWGLATDEVAVPVARNQAARDPNMGIRAGNDGLGRFVPGHQRYLDNGAIVEGAIEEDISVVRAHNDLVSQSIRDIVPFGHTPLAAMLGDALSHYTNGTADDVANLCRRRVLVVVTDGLETPYYGGESCAVPLTPAEIAQLTQDGVTDLYDYPRSQDCADASGTCLWQPIPSAGTTNVPTFCNADAVCGAINPAAKCRDYTHEGQVTQACLVPACAYHPAWPYDPAAAYAKRLYEMGVITYVIGFNPAPGREATIQRIAKAGAPGEGPDGRDGWFIARTEDELRDAFKRIVTSVFTEVVAGQPPVIMTPSDGDDLNGQDEIRQWRLFTYSEKLQAGDTSLYGRVYAEAYGCPAGGVNDNDPSIERLDSFRFDERFSARAESRRSLSRNPNTGGLFAVTGAGDAMFGDDGAPQAGALVPAVEARAFAGVANNDALRVVGQLFNGYFGDVGLPNGALAARGSKQIGSIESGNMAVIGAPSIGVNSPGYAAFVNSQRNRPTLVGGGARDGLVHLYRAKDGFEVMSFVPRLSWREVRNGSYPADGPTVAGEVVACRSLVDGAAGACPAELAEGSFRTMLVGGVGRGGGVAGGANLWGVDLTKISDLADAGRDANPLVVDDIFADGGRPFVWNVTDDSVASTTQVAKLGLTVSEPVLTHIRIGDEIRGAVVAGCGEDPNPATAREANAAGKGRCVLIVDASSGAVLSRFEDAAMDLPVIGSAAVYPSGSLSPAERIYIGDAGGRLWRIDLRDSNRANWRAERAWPSDAAPDPEYQTAGRGIYGRPAIVSQGDGQVTVLFGQGEEGKQGTAHVVSFTDRLEVVNGVQQFTPTPNWVMPLRPGEYTTTAPVVYDGTALLTTVTAPAAVAVCSPQLSRLYALHYKETLVAENGDRRTYERDDGALLYVKPMLERFDDQGRSVGKALSLVLPPGLKVAGMALANTPSCREGEAPSTDLILSGSTDGAGVGQGAGGRARQALEYPEAGQLRSVPFDDSVYVESGRVGLRICLNCDRNGRPASGYSNRLAPFPSQVLFWGTSFTD